MTRASVLPIPAATSNAVAARNDRLASVASGVRDRVDAVRLAIHNAAPAGFQGRVAKVMGWRKERPSREHTGVEKLSVDLVLAEVAMHEEEGRPDEATKILATFQRKQTPVIRLRDGQYLLEFE